MHLPCRLAPPFALSALLALWSARADPTPPSPDYALRPTGNPALPLVDDQGTAVTALDGVAFPSASSFGGDPDLSFPVGSAAWILGSPDVARAIDGAFSVSFWAADVPATGIHPIPTPSSPCLPVSTSRPRTSSPPGTPETSIPAPASSI
jgi:hypothetical protein